MNQESLYEQLAESIGVSGSKFLPRLFEMLADENDAKILLAASPAAYVDEISEKTGIPSDEIEKRIESLERINRCWRRMTGIFAALLLISLTVGAKPSGSILDVLRAKRIEVLTPDGKPGIVLSVYSDGSAIGLTAPGQDHKRRIIMSTHREGVNLMLMKHAEAPLFIANVDDNGSSLSLFDAREPSQNPGGIILSSMLILKIIFAIATIVLFYILIAFYK